MQRWDSSISLLRTLVDFEPYMLDSAAPAWLQNLSRVAQNDPGVLALLGPTGLSLESDGIKHSRIVPDTPSLLLSGLVDRLRSSARHVAIGIPPVARHLPLLLAGSSVLANVIDQTAIGPGRGNGSVLIVSPDLDARSRYCDLHVGSELLDDAYPGSRMRPDGQQVPLRAIRTPVGVHGVCFFLPLLSLPNGIAMRPSTIVLDVRYARWARRISDLASWAASVEDHAGVAALYTLGDTDTQLALTAAGFKDCPFDQAAILACTQHMHASAPHQNTTVDWDMAVAPSYLQRRHEVALASRSSEVEHALADANRLLFEHAQNDGPFIRRARWILATLNHLPVPLVVYEYSARALGRKTLRSLIDGLESTRRGGYGAASMKAGDNRISEALDRVYQALWQQNPRMEALKSLLPGIASDAGAAQVLVLVRDLVVARAVQSWIADEEFPRAPWIQNLDIAGCPDYLNAVTHQYCRAIVIGALPRRYMWIAGASLAPAVTFVAYQHEVAAIRRQLESVYSAEGLRERARMRGTFMHELIPNAQTVGGSESIIPPLEFDVLPLTQAPAAAPGSPKQIPVPKPRVTIRDLRQLGDALQQLAQHQPSEDQPEETVTWTDDLGEEEAPDDETVLQGEPGPGYSEPVLCLRLTVLSRANGQGIMWLPQDRPIEVYRQAAADDLLMLTPGKLKPGDVILVTRDLERTSLFDRIVRLAESQPHMRYLAARRKVWQDAVRHMATRYTIAGQVDYPRLLRDLQTAGAPIQSELAVRFWVQGDVIGPEKIHSIIAVGKVSGSPDLVQRAREFDQAFRDIRGIRQGLGIRLSAAIRQAFRHATERDVPATTRLNDHLGIAIDELIDSIDLAEVLSVDTMAQRIPAQQVGRFQRL